MIPNHKFYAVLWKIKNVPSDYRLVMENGRPMIFDNPEKAHEYAIEKFDKNEHACSMVVTTLLVCTGV